MFLCPSRSRTRPGSTPRAPRRATRRARLAPRMLGMLAAGILIGAALPARAAAPQLVIEDNDFLGPGGSDQQSIIPLLFNPGVSVLGFTVVTGDGWENEESAHLRRFLDIIGRGDVPVADGAVYPLINSVPMMRVREQQFGTIPWKGAWGGIGSIDGTPVTQPPLPPLKDGTPSRRPIDESAALFLIRQVHAHPHQVTIVAAGPLTNLALAIRMDPTFAATAKQLLFMGGMLDTSVKSLTGNADFASDFNMIFDPEAAHITLTAPWASITVVGSVSNDLMMTRDYLKRITQKKTPMTDYIGTYYDALPMWDELATAIAADPSLITGSVEGYMDIDISKGPQYGHAVVWPDATAPKAMGVRKVRIVQSVDARRFLDVFLREAQSDVPAPGPSLGAPRR
jgi:inosine-uridine nucleoside N-ribohydrolase